MRIRLGTRGSDLALAQSGEMARALEALGAEVEIVIVRTAGDRDQTSRFAQIGAPGLFVRELEQALSGGEVDLAVHSYKDLPSESPDDLVVAAVPRREDPADVLVARPEACDETGPLGLVAGARVGTASARRVALVEALAPSLALEHLRGNVPTRVGRVASGELDAAVLAAAGLRRLARGTGKPAVPAPLRSIALDVASFTPAPSQGALALQVRAGDAARRELVGRLEDPETALAVRAERHVLARLAGGCELPFGAHATVDGGTIVLRAALGTGQGLVRADARGDDPVEVADAAWSALEPAASDER